jgi:hypothetical protein
MPDDGGFKQKFEEVRGQPESGVLECVSLASLAGAQIPPRPWAYGRFLLFVLAAVRIRA